MPGPKMGPRPADFDEQLVKQSPTYTKWAALPQGAKIRYACREFIKGRPNDEERLMRRIMIARRNNIKDHEVLKKARSVMQVGQIVKPLDVVEPSLPKQFRVRRPASVFADSVVEKEMDVAAVEKTRSYRTWVLLEEGQEFIVSRLGAFRGNTVDACAKRIWLTRASWLWSYSTIKNTSRVERVMTGCYARTSGAVCDTAAKTRKWWKN